MPDSPDDPSATPFAYRALARVADLALPLAGSLSAKLGIGDRERRAALGRWRRWATEARDPSRPLLWMHAPSVGEGLQAEAILSVLRPRHPNWQIVFSFFSPSAAPLATRQPADHADYLPYDTTPNVEAMLDALAPTALVFTKADLWPELATRAGGRGVAVGLVAGTVSPVSRRRQPVTRWLSRSGYAALDRAAAIADADADGLSLLGTPSDRVVIAGDPRFDSALDRARAVPKDWPYRRLTADAPTLVAGSTWPPDEAVLADAAIRIHDRHPDTRFVIVPHEPTDSHVSELMAVLREGHLRPVRLSALASGGAIPPAVVVDRAGLLAGLYLGATAAYVGGGFGTAGLHSVLEPAAAGVPVIFGPHWRSSREAGMLLAAGAATALTPGATAADSAAELAAVWHRWMNKPAGRDTAGRRALAVVEGELGAAERNAEVVEQLMMGGTR